MDSAKFHTHTLSDGTVITHVHSSAEKKAVTNRLARIIGHLESIKRMVETNADCSDVIIQLAAVRSAVNSVGKVVIKNHISRCIVEAVKWGDEQTIADLNNAIDRFIK